MLSNESEGNGAGGAVCGREEERVEGGAITETAERVGEEERKGRGGARQPSPRAEGLARPRSPTARPPRCSRQNSTTAEERVGGRSDTGREREEAQIARVKNADDPQKQKERRGEKQTK